MNTFQNKTLMDARLAFALVLCCALYFLEQGTRAITQLRVSEEKFVALRYQRQKLYSERPGVTTHEGLDPLTGLPVLIYEFAGKPDPALADLESENIPGILETTFEVGKGQVVVAYSRGYTPAGKPLPIPSATFVLESAKALSDAARAGVIHGDLRPERFLISSGHVLVEGFGIPWQSSPSAYVASEGIASYAGDVYAYGRIMQELAPDLPVPLKTLLERCLSRKPEDRPSAGQLLNALVALQRSPQATEESVATTETTQGATTTQPTTQPSESKATFQPPLIQNAGTPKTLEIDFTVSEPEEPAPVVMPPVKVPPTSATRAGTLPDMPDLDLFPEETAPSGFNASDFNRDFEARDFNDDDFDLPAPSTKRSVAQDNWDDDQGMLLETDSGLKNSNASLPSPGMTPKTPLPPKTSSKLPETGPKRTDTQNPSAKKIDPKQTFIKDLPPGGTYKAGKSADTSPVPFKDTPVAPTFDEVFLKGNRSPKNTRRIVMVVGLLLSALVLAGLVFFRNAGTVPGNETTSSTSYIVSVNVAGDVPPLDLLVVSSPADSKFRAGAVVSKVPGQIVLDKAGTWQFQGRFQDVLSDTVTLQLPQERNLTIIMPALLTPEEGAETPEGEAIPPTTPDDANP